MILSVPLLCLFGNSTEELIRELFLLECEAVLVLELVSEREPRSLGATFLSSGLMAGIEAQKRPVFTSTALQIAILGVSPKLVSKLRSNTQSWTYKAGLDCWSALAV